jgi:hypothetical protein
VAGFRRAPWQLASALGVLARHPPIEALTAFLRGLALMVLLLLLGLAACYLVYWWACWD